MTNIPNRAYVFRLSATFGTGQLSTPSELALSLRTLADDLELGTAGNADSPITMTASTTIAGNLSNDTGNHVGHWNIKPSTHSR